MKLTKLYRLSPHAPASGVVRLPPSHSHQPARLHRAIDGISTSPSHTGGHPAAPHSSPSP